MRAGFEFRMSACGLRMYSRWSFHSGRRQTRSPVASLASSTRFRRPSSSQNMPALKWPSATTTPPVSVAMSTIAVGSSVSQA